MLTARVRLVIQVDQSAECQVIRATKDQRNPLDPERVGEGLRAIVSEQFCARAGVELIRAQRTGDNRTADRTGSDSDLRCRQRSLHDRADPHGAGVSEAQRAGAITERDGGVPTLNNASVGNGSSYRGRRQGAKGGAGTEQIAIEGEIGRAGPEDDGRVVAQRELAPGCDNEVSSGICEVDLIPGNARSQVRRKRTSHGTVNKGNIGAARDDTIRPAGGEVQVVGVVGFGTSGGPEFACGKGKETETEHPRDGNGLKSIHTISLFCIDHIPLMRTLEPGPPTPSARMGQDPDQDPRRIRELRQDAYHTHAPQPTLSVTAKRPSHLWKDSLASALCSGNDLSNLHSESAA